MAKSREQLKKIAEAQKINFEQHRKYINQIINIAMAFHNPKERKNMDKSDDDLKAIFTRFAEEYCSMFCKQAAAEYLFLKNGMMIQYNNRYEKFVKEISGENKDV